MGKQQINERKQELFSMSQQLTDQVQEQRNIIFSSTNSLDTQQQKEKIKEIQNLYKLREKNLKQRIDSYKKELIKRDKVLEKINKIVSSSSSSTNSKLFKKEIIKELRSLQIERSKMINRRDLKNQIKEREQQITFLIDHFGKESAENSLISSSTKSSSTFSAKKELTQIELDLNNALKPLQIDTNQENININSANHKLSAYHFVPATSSSESKKDENHSMLAQIFGDGTPLQQKQHQSKYKK